jgi:tripeptidyl-peptidase-1
MQRQCNEWMKLGLQGVTVVVASGDQGVGENGNCMGNNFDIFTPYYISTCPYVLSVGATELNTPAGQQPAPGQKLAERAASGFGSGGGFSNVFDRPNYQAAAVQKYLSTASLPFGSYTQTVNETEFGNVTSGVFRATGRGYPDVAAVGSRVLIAYNGGWLAVNGTSAATPLWAGILTLVNEARLAAGRATVGFVNPTLVRHLFFQFSFSCNAVLGET